MNPTDEKNRIRDEEAEDDSLAGAGRDGPYLPPPPPDSPVYNGGDPTAGTGGSGYDPAGDPNTKTTTDPGTTVVDNDVVTDAPDDPPADPPPGDPDPGTGDPPPAGPDTNLPGTNVPAYQAYTPYSPTPGANRTGQQSARLAEQYAQDWLASPSRYDMDVVKQSMGVIHDRMNEIRRTGFNDGQDYLASMGTLGGTRAAELQGMRRGQYDRQEQEQLASLNREMAMTQGEDRSRAYDAIMRMAGFREGQFQFDSDLGFRKDSLAENSRQFGTSTAERARQFAEDLGFRRDSMDEGSRQFDEDLDYRRGRGDADDAYRDEDLDFRREAEKNRNRNHAMDGLGWNIDDLPDDFWESLGISRPGGSSANDSSYSGSYTPGGNGHEYDPDDDLRGNKNRDW